MAHVAAGRVVQLGLLQVKLRTGEAVKRPDVVVMHMGQDHVGDGIAVEPYQRQRLGRTTQMPPPARLCDLGGATCSFNFDFAFISPAQTFSRPEDSSS
jgi:hypothetical protein